MPSTATSILDGLSTSTAVKAPVAATTSGNITLAGLQSYAEDDRILVWQQSTASENGIYAASSGSWTRTKDFDGNRDVRKGTLIPVEGSPILYRVTSSNPIIIGTSSISFEALGPTQTQSDIGLLLNPLTLAEDAASLTPTNYAIPSHEATGGIVLPYRYGTNTTPGTTDMTAVLNAAATFCRTGDYVLQLPAETCLVSSSLNFSGIRVVGSKDTSNNIQASSAQFDVITTTGNSTFENFTVHGGWDGSTAGLSGDTFSLDGGTFCYNVHFHNVNITFNKKRGIYWEGAGYSHLDHVDCTQSGLHGIEIFGTGASQSTTVQIFGQSRFSDCPNGYAAKLTECVSVGFNGCIMENTKGIQLNGADNRALSFEHVHQEGTIGGLFLDGTGSAGIGLRFAKCYGAATTSVANITGWQEVSYDSNAALTLPPVPLDNRIKQADGGQLTTSTTGGVDVTAVSISLPPGTWLLYGTLQTLTNTATTLVRSSCVITGNASANGLINNTDSGFAVGADEQTYSPGVSLDHRCNVFDIVQLTTTTTMYLRARLNFSGAGALTYRGFINAVLFS